MNDWTYKNSTTQAPESRINLTRPENSAMLTAGLTLLREAPPGCVNLAFGAQAASAGQVPVEKASDTPDNAIKRK